jgi:predicted nucleotidyltransferase
MNRQEAIDILVAHRDALRARGVRHAALFGSVARGEGRPDSDVDILIELEPDAEFDAFEYAD